MPALMGEILLGIYALLLGIGGIVGYLKAGSRPSLIAGLASALVAAGCLALCFYDPPLGFWLGLVLAATLVVLFQTRYRRTRKFMPSGLLLLVSGLVVLVLLALVLWPESRS